MSKLNAGDLCERVAFDKRGSAGDGYGGTETEFAEQFTVWAQYKHLRGSETIIAARIEGRHSQIIRIRASSNARAITSDWRARDARTGDTFAILEVVMAEDRSYIDLLCERGVAQ